MSARELLSWAGAHLSEAGCGTPRLDAEVLLMHAWGIDKTQLIIRMHDTPPADIDRRFRAMIERRERREPVAYIVGEREFWSRPFTVTPDVLIPRPETEHLIEAALRLLPERGNAYRLCDIGTGSGCIAVTLACEFPHSSVVMTDLSEKALAIALKNASRHGAGARTEGKIGDMFSALEPGDRFDLIVSNPPYVARHEMETLAPELAFEPAGALTDGDDGLRYLRILLEHAGRWLKPGGRLIVETGTCGLPPAPPGMVLEEEIVDLAGLLRGGIYRPS